MNAEIFPHLFLGSPVKEEVRHQELSQGEPALLVQVKEFQESSISDNTLPLPLSSNLDDISGCLASEAQGQNRLELAGKPRLLGIIPEPRANHKMQCKGLILNKNLVEGHQKNGKKC